MHLYHFRPNFINICLVGLQGTRSKRVLPNEKDAYSGILVHNIPLTSQLG